MTAALIVPTEATAALETQRDSIVTNAEALVVQNQGSLEAAGAMLTDFIKPMLKEIAEACDPVCSAANAAHKAATKQRKDLQAPLLEAETIVKGKMGTYVQAENRKRIAEEQRIAREEAAAEANRVQEEQEAIQRAAAAEAAGRPEEAEAIIEQAVERTEQPLPPPRVAPPPPRKVAGVNIREEWECEVTDMREFLRAVLAGQAPEAAVSIDIGKLNKMVRAMDGQMQWAGVKISKTSRVASRGR
jgi:hypothetical protein